MKKLMLVTIAALIGSAAPAFGQINNPAAAVDRLRFETSRLDQAVTYSNLGNQVRYATFQYYRESDVLYRCVISRDRRGRGDRDIIRPIPPNQPHQPPRALCIQEIRRTDYAFGQVDNLLWNSQQQAPQVYYQYVRTRQAHQQAMHALATGGGGGNTGLLRATGYINRIQFGFQGRGQADIINQCLNWGQRYNVLQVRELYVNGRMIPVGSAINIRQACQTVAAHAIRGLNLELE